MRFVQFYYSYLSESALNGCSLDQQLDPNPSLASETLGNGRRIPALLFSWNVLPSVARWSNTSGQLRYSSMGEFEEPIIQKFYRYMIQDNDPNRFILNFLACVAWRFWLGAQTSQGGRRWAKAVKLRGDWGGSNEVFIFLAASPLVRGRFSRFCDLPLDSAPYKTAMPRRL